jgi:hypothetical protein
MRDDRDVAQVVAARELCLSHDPLLLKFDQAKSSSR